MIPSEGTSPASARSSVVLPAPFGPTNATRCPGDSASETSRSTRRPAKVTLTSLRGDEGGVGHATPPESARRSRMIR